MRAYESRTDTYEDVAARFAIGPATLLRWVQRQREIGTLDPLAKAGGWASPHRADRPRRPPAHAAVCRRDDVTRRRGIHLTRQQEND